MAHRIILMAFSSEGFECVVDLTEVDQRCIMAKLAGEKIPKSPDDIIHLISLRARFNQHRNMEVWAIKVDSELTVDIFEELAESNPQEAADLARKGTPIFGASNKKNQVIE